MRIGIVEAKLKLQMLASQKKLVSFAESLDGVRKVNKSDTVANTLNSVNKLVWYVSVVIIAILLAVSIFLISNTVTMGITVRREEIAIMKYIGAKNGFVPFTTEKSTAACASTFPTSAMIFFA